jgi:deoxyribodipyrimidine photolyase-related protein
MKMMDFKKGEWCNTMDGLYWRFIDRNRKFFLTNPRLSMMVRIFDKMKMDRKKLILYEADKFIKQNTI